MPVSKCPRIILWKPEKKLTAGAPVLADSGVLVRRVSKTAEVSRLKSGYRIEYWLNISVASFKIDSCVNHISYGIRKILGCKLRAKLGWNWPKPVVSEEKYSVLYQNVGSQQTNLPHTYPFRAQWPLWDLEGSSQSENQRATRNLGLPKVPSQRYWRLSLLLLQTSAGCFLFRCGYFADPWLWLELSPSFEGYILEAQDLAFMSRLRWQLGEQTGQMCLPYQFLLYRDVDFVELSYHAIT